MLRVASLSVALVLIMVASALAGPSANEFKFVGAANACGPNYPAGAKIVQSLWQTGIGLPDNGETNVPPVADPANIPSAGDNRNGLLLMKNGTTANCSSAGVTFAGFAPFILPPGPVWITDPLPLCPFCRVGFDYLNGSACGGGSPRFNISWTPSSGGPTQFSFVGNCSLGDTRPAPQDPDNWSRVSWDVRDGGANPPIPNGATITAVSVVFDEGTDIGPGFAIIDNILVNGKFQSAESKTCPPGSFCTGDPN